MSVLSVREAEPVAIGTVTLYCESFKVSASAELNEKPTVTGGTVLTNSCVRYTRLTLTGRVCGRAAPAELIASLNALMGGQTAEVICRGVKYQSCIVQSYTAEELESGIIRVTVTLAAAGTEAE